ncbi:MAG: hypothetical protein ACM33B_14740 [Pseudomonadota bacterium]
MSDRNTRRIVRLILFSLAAWAFTALRREQSRPRPAAAADAALRPESRHLDVPGWASSPARPDRTRPVRTRRRLAVNLAFVALFFTGASFSAFAGDNVAGMLEGDGGETLVLAQDAPAADESTGVPQGSAVVDADPEPAPVPETTPAPAPEPAPAEEATAEAAPAAAPAAEAPAPEDVAPATDDGEADLPPAPTREEAVARVSQPRPSAARTATAFRAAPVATHAPSVEVDPEVHEANLSATVWLHRELPDPTPPSLRLAPRTASRLSAAAKGAGLDWAYLLAVIRADGSSATAVPTRRATLAETAHRLASLRSDASRWDAALAYTGRTAAADRAMALARYYRAVGLQTLVDGLLARKDALAEKVLNDERVQLYAGGRDDVQAGRIDVRVLALVEYLAESYGQVTVSSLMSGHRLYARPGVVSMHMYGEAVDVAALGGTPIAGHQEPGGLTERAVRDILLLPAEMRPRQVISLLGLGGPSFPLADHADHIHVGF